MSIEPLLTVPVTEHVTVVFDVNGPISTPTVQGTAGALLVFAIALVQAAIRP